MATVGPIHTHGRHWLMRLALAASTLIVVPPALAQRAEPGARPRVVVTRSYDAGRAQATEIADALAGQLRLAGLNARRPMPPAETLDESGPLTVAEAAYNNLRPADALELVEGILSRADADGGAHLEREQLLRTLMLQAMAALAMGNEEVVPVALGRVLAIEPLFEPDPALYPPTLRERLEGERSDTTAVEIDIVGLVGGARLRLDGQPLPEGMRTITLAAGIHLLACSAPGHRSSGRRIDVSEPTREVSFSLSRDEEGELVQAGPPATGLSAGARNAARSLGIELVLVDLWQSDGESTVRATDLGSGRVAELVLDADAEASNVALLITRMLLPPAQPEESGDSALPWIVAGGVLAAAATVVTIVVVTSGGSADGFAVTWERE